MFESKLFCSSPSAAAAAARRATAPGGAFGSPSGRVCGGGGGAFANAQAQSLGGLPPSCGGTPEPHAPTPGGCRALSPAPWADASAAATASPRAGHISAPPLLQPLDSFDAACISRGLSPDFRRSFSPAPWLSPAGPGSARGEFHHGHHGHSHSHPWDCASSDGGGGRSAASSPDPATYRPGWAAAGGACSRLGDSGARMGVNPAAARRLAAGSEPGCFAGPNSLLHHGSGIDDAASSTFDSSCGGAGCALNSSDGGATTANGSANTSSGGACGPAVAGRCGLAFAMQHPGVYGNGGGPPSRPMSSMSAAVADDDDDAMCVVEVAMAAAVEATTRPPRGGRGGKHRQKAKLNQSLQQLAGHADADAAQAYVETCLAAYRKLHAGDAVSLELLTRHLAYLIGGVVRFKLQGMIPWSKLPVPALAELSDKSRTPNYRSWLTRLGVVAPDAFGSAGGADSPLGASGGGAGAFGDEGVSDALFA